MSNELTPHTGSLPQLYTQPMAPTPAGPPLAADLRGNGWAGFLVIVLFFVVGGGWAATAPLSGAVIASGQVNPDSNRQTVQHLEGGIIREFRARPGDVVQAGEVVAVLEDVRALAEVGRLTAQLRALAAQEARLRAERDGVEDIAFNHPSLSDRSDPEVQAAIDHEVSQFHSRRENDASRIAILRQRVAQLQQQITGSERQLESVQRQRELIREELAAVQALFEKGYERKPRLLELKRTEARLTGTEGELISDIARAMEGIGETELEIANIRVERVEELDKELSTVHTERVQTEKVIAESIDKLSRTEVVAPVTGTVLDVRLKTIGGVVAPGDPIMDIVPIDDTLVITARVSPTDIDNVHAGLAAEVIFPSYPQRTMSRIPGVLDTVSPDSFQDERTGEFYFKAKVLVGVEDIERIAPYVTLQAGLPAEVYIKTSERTMLDYLMDPVIRSLHRSFKEIY